MTLPLKISGLDNVPDHVAAAMGTALEDISAAVERFLDAAARASDPRH
jgi:hypothetical protein